MRESRYCDFLAQFDESRYPCDFLARYEALECLSYNDLGETLLVREQKSGDLFVAKCRLRENKPVRTPSFSVLKSLDHPGLPAFVEEFENGIMSVTLRAYVAGRPLCELETPLTLSEIVDVGVQLCDVLIYLHGLTPPLLHRDVKPQNVILGDDGRVTLIDFGIARLLDAQSLETSTFYGTTAFAPPEQYGFSQTDCRSDIFSLGVLLMWLATGETNASDALYKIANKKLRRIIGRCTSFAPKDRYADVGAVKRALTSLRPAARARRLALCACLCALLVAAIYLIGGTHCDKTGNIEADGHINYTVDKGISSEVEFTQPLIEKAARAALGKAEGESMTRSELSRVTELYALENEVYTSSEAFYAAIEDWYRTTDRAGRGPIDSIEDIALMPNLRILGLAAQRFTDLTPLAGLSSLEKVEFKHGAIKDASALAGLTNLASVGLNDNPVTDLSALSGLTKLRFLDLCDADDCDSTFLDSLNDFDFLDISNRTDSYKRLSGKRAGIVKLGYSGIDSLDRLSGVKGLRELEIQGTRIKDLTPLLSFSDLQTVTLDESMRALADNLVSPSFSIIYR